MAKKKIDLWADHTPVETPKQASANTDDVFDVKGKSAKKEKGSKAKKDKKEKMSIEEKQIAKEHKILRNPLTKVEGSSEVGADISVAVSAALSKAIHENYEIDKLNQILDVVIDGVEDPDLANDSLRRKNFGLIPLFLVIASFIAAIIIIPVIMLIGFSINTVSDGSSAKSILGYDVYHDGDEDPKYSATHFYLQEVESGKYLSAPVNGSGDSLSDAFTPSGTKLTLTDNFYEANNDFYFYEGIDGFQILWTNFESGDTRRAGIQSNKNEDTVVFTDNRYLQSGSYLIPHRGHEGEFAIGFDNTSSYLGFEDDEAVLTNDPTFFNIVADVDYLTSTQDLYNSYMSLYGNENLPSGLDFGAAGNVFSLFSLDSKKYINSYKEIDEDEAPFIEVDSNEYRDSLYLSKTSDTNFFVTLNEDPTNDIAFGSYQTTAFDWSKINFGGDDTVEPEGDARASEESSMPKQTQYPLISVNKSGDVFLQQYTDAYTNTLNENGAAANSTISYDETAVQLLQNPSDLHQFAIYFPYANAFLSTEDNKVGLKENKYATGKPETYDEFQELEYFNIEFASTKNPEYARTFVNGIKSQTAKLSVDTYKNELNMMGYTIDLFGVYYEDVYELATITIPAIWADGRYTASEKWDQTLYAIGHTEHASDTYYNKVAKKGADDYLTMKGLEPDYWYFGYTTIYRNNNKDVGNHETSTPIAFKTAGTTDPINWDDGTDVDIETPEAGNPTDDAEIDTPAIVTAAFETTAVSNADSVNVASATDDTNDIVADEMGDVVGTTIDVTVGMENGEIDKGTSGVVTGIKATLYEEDGTSEVHSIEETTTSKIDGLESGQYTFRFEGLDEQTNYKLGIEVRDIEDEWFTPLIDDGSGKLVEAPLVDVDTERNIPKFTAGSINEEIQLTGEGNVVDLSYEDVSVFGSILDTDSINFVFEYEGMRSETGWQKISKYSTRDGVEVPGTSIIIKFQDYSLIDGYHLKFTGLDNIDYQIKAYLYVGDPSDDLFEDIGPDGENLWENATLWTEDVNGMSGDYNKTVKYLTANFEAS